MLKNIADEFPLASIEAFQKCKVFFVHAAGKTQTLSVYFSFLVPPLIQLF
jgi:hypothetical protein